MELEMLQTFDNIDSSTVESYDHIKTAIDLYLRLQEIFNMPERRTYVQREYTYQDKPALAMVDEEVYQLLAQLLHHINSTFTTPATACGGGVVQPDSSNFVSYDLFRDNPIWIQMKNEAVELFRGPASKSHANMIAVPPILCEQAIAVGMVAAILRDSKKKYINDHPHDETSEFSSPKSNRYLINTLVEIGGEMMNPWVTFVKNYYTLVLAAMAEV